MPWNVLAAERVTTEEKFLATRRTMAVWSSTDKGLVVEGVTVHDGGFPFIQRRGSG